MNENDNKAIEKIKKAFQITNLVDYETRYGDKHQNCKYYYNNQNEITEVEFKNFLFTDLPDSIVSLSKLEKFSLTRSYAVESDYFDSQGRNFEDTVLKRLPQSFGSLENLKHVDVTGNMVEYLPDSFGNLINLQTIIFSENNLLNLPGNFKNLQNFTNLDLSHNKFIDIPEVITQIKNLKKLKINYNSINLLPESIENLTNLQNLSLNNCNLTFLPTQIGKLSNLRNLSLMYNELKLIPETIGSLSNLEKLNLNANKNLQQIPNSISELINLKELFLGGTLIEKLPKDMGNLSNLNSIAITKKQTESFSEVGADLPQLKRIIILPVHCVDWSNRFYSRSSSYKPIKNFEKFSTGVQKCFEELRERGCHILEG